MFLKEIYPKEPKSRAKYAYSRTETSSSAFYLAGLVGDEIKGLDLSSGESSWNFPISAYADLGQFIAFATESYDDFEKHKMDGNQFDYTCAIRNGSGVLTSDIYKEFDAPFMQNGYLLSKKTGNIYNGCQYSPLGGSENWSLSNFILGDNVLYASYSYENGRNGYWAIISEENGKLKIKKSDMLDFISDNLSDNKIGRLHVDKYGNIQVDNNIYGYNQKTIVPDFGEDLVIDHDSYLGVFYTFYNGDFYILNGLEFQKYDGVIFGSRLDDSDAKYYFDATSHYYYCVDDNGNYSIGYDESEEYRTRYVYSVNESGYKLIIDLMTSGFPSGNKKIMAEIDDYILLSYPSKNNGYTLIRSFGVYTYLVQDRKILNTINAKEYDNVVRSNYIYYVGEDYKLMKYDYIKDSEEAVETYGYQIKTITTDGVGNIVLTGYDSSFKEFTGYLDENDGVTFNPVIDNGGYDVIYMNPIN